MTPTKADPSQSQNNSDLQNLCDSLVSLDRQLRRDAKVPKQLSVGVAAIILFGKRFDGTFPTDRFMDFSQNDLFI